MASNGFVDTVFTDGIRHPNFFNGRLFTAEDMTQDAQADHEHVELAGQAIGAGVVSGLWVTGTGSRVTVAAGLAMSRRGAALRLPVTTSFDISPAAARPAPPDAVFTDCHPVGAPVSATAAGPYLVVIGPAWRFEGSVPMQSVVATPAATVGCGRKWRVEGVGFRLVPLAPPAAVASDAARRRNRLAHWLLGTDSTRDSDGIDAPDEPLLDTLPGVTPDVVPLALLYWTGNAIDFVDNWAARRRVTHPAATLPWLGQAGSAASPPLPSASAFGSYVSDWRIAEAQARFLQFEDHVSDLANRVPPVGESIARHFRFLPPLGIVPIAGASTQDPQLVTRSPRGLHLGTFLGRSMNQLYHASREELGLRHPRSLSQEAIDTDNTSQWPYSVTFLVVQENVTRVTSDRSAQFYVIFVRQWFYWY